MHRRWLSIILAGSLLLTGCAGGNMGEQGRQQDDREYNSLEQNASSLPLMVNGEVIGSLEVRKKEKEQYVPLVSFLEALQYHVLVSENNQTIQAGFTDVLYSFKIGSDTAEAEGKQVQLHEPVKLQEGQAYITVTSLTKVFDDAYEIELTEDTLRIQTADEEIDFREDENLGDVIETSPEEVPAVAPATADKLLATAQNYIGTPYRFGAKAGDTSVFDCSSFTQHVFKQHGIQLPRTSRAQAQGGRFISVAQLQKGDLVFFYWPGRYENNTTVGHVGIYMGNGRVIHATPKDGVHIVNAAQSSYWKRTYLGAKRIG